MSTDRLYYGNPYQHAFSARIVSQKQKGKMWAVVLDSILAGWPNWAMTYTLLSLFPYIWNRPAHYRPNSPNTPSV